MIFLYAESKNSRIKKKKDYVGYLNYECGITNPDIYHRKLINEGFYVSASFKEKLEQLKVPELKLILQENNLPVKGKKAELIELIVDEVPMEKVPISNEEIYSLSEKVEIVIKPLKVSFVKKDFVENFETNYEEYLTEFINSSRFVTDNGNRKYTIIEQQSRGESDIKNGPCELDYKLLMDNKTIENMNYYSGTILSKYI